MLTKITGDTYTNVTYVKCTQHLQVHGLNILPPTLTHSKYMITHLTLFIVTPSQATVVNKLSGDSG